MALAVLAGLAGPVGAVDDVVTLTVPKALQSSEIVYVHVTIGVVARGQEVELYDANDRRIGTVSPFGIRPGAAAGAYVIPVPRDAIRDGTLSLRLRITQANGPPRLPTGDEVTGLSLSVGPGQP